MYIHIYYFFHQIRNLFFSFLLRAKAFFFRLLDHFYFFNPRHPWYFRAWRTSSFYFVHVVIVHLYSLNIYIYIYTNLPVDIIVWLPHPRSGDSQGQERFLAPSAEKQTHYYDIDCSNHHPSLSTLRPKRLSHSNMKWWAIYTNFR